MDRLKSYKNLGKDTNYIRQCRNEVTIQLRKKEREEHVMKRLNLPVNPERTSSDDEEEENGDDGEEEEGEGEEKRYASSDAIGAARSSEGICSSKLLDRLAAKGYTSYNKNLGKEPYYRRYCRNEVTIQIRKKAREEIFMKRRHISMNPDATTMTTTTTATSTITNTNNTTTTTNTTNTSDEEDKKILNETIDIAKLAEKMCSPKLSDRNEPLKIICKAIAFDKPGFKEEISSNNEIMQKLVESLKQSSSSSNPKFQYDACWCLTNIAAGTTEQTARVALAGAVPLLVDLIDFKAIDICEQALWCLGNIIGNGRTWRDYVLRHDIIGPLLSFVGANIPRCLLRTISWVILNLCRYRDYPPPPIIIKGVLSSMDCLIREKDPCVLFNTVWTVNCLCDGIDQIQMVVDSDVLPTMIGFLAHREEKLQVITLRTLGKILAGTNQQTQYVINYDVISFFPSLMRHTKQPVRKDAVWCLSNILAGNQFQMQMIIDAGLIPMLIECLINETFQVQKQAAWAITNLLILGNTQQITTVIRYGAIPPLCELLACKDSEVINVILECFTKLLEGKSGEIVSDLIDDYDGIEKIEALRYFPNKDIYDKAYNLLLSFPEVIVKKRN